MEEARALLPVVQDYAAKEFPRLATGKEFREHTKRSFLHPRYGDLERLEVLLDEYAAAAVEYRKLCAVRDHGFTELQQLHEQHIEKLKLRDFQQRYCIEMAQWEPGLNLEQQALARLQNQALVDPWQAQILKDTIRHLFHRDDVPHLDRDAPFEQRQSGWREQQALEVLEQIEQTAAGKNAIAALRRAETLLHENASAGEWLAEVCEAGQPLPTLAQMQADLEETERQIKQIGDHLEKKRQHLTLHADHIRTSFTSTAARLTEVCKCFHQLRERHLADLVKRNEDGFLSRMYETIKSAEKLLVRAEAAHLVFDAPWRKPLL
jgi:hypothetical protein